MTVVAHLVIGAIAVVAFAASMLSLARAQRVLDEIERGKPRR